MNPAYRIPDTADASIPPGTTPKVTVPINRYNVRSFITSLADGAEVAAGREILVRGIAFDGGYGVNEVLFSQDDGRTWQATRLGKDLGKYSFREWTIPLTPSGPGVLQLKCRAKNRLGQTQPMDVRWNPAGYMRNVVETIKVTVT